MKNSKLRRALLLVACAVMLVSVSVSATLAYLTSKTGVVTNTFSVGNVKIDLDETDVDLYGVKDGETSVKKNDYKLIPGHEYVKDPTVHVDAKSENAWLFVRVTNPITAIEAETTIFKQMTDGDKPMWTLIEGNANDGVYAYLTQVKAGDNIKVFNNFTLKDDLKHEDIESYAGKTITVQAYAVQVDGFTTYSDAWAKAPCTWGEETTGGSTEDTTGETTGDETTGA